MVGVAALGVVGVAALGVVGMVASGVVGVAVVEERQPDIKKNAITDD